MATEWQQYLSEEGYDQYQKVLRLLELDAINDSEQEPFKFKYEAREILINICEKLKSYLEGHPNEPGLKLQKAVVDLKLGVNFVETEELSTGEEHIQRCLDDLEEFRLHPDACNIYCSTLNNLGILWTGRRNNEKALTYLVKAEDLYQQYKDQIGGAPKSVDEFFEPIQDDEDKVVLTRSVKFEDTYTHTLYYMAQVYGKLGESEKSAKYCQTTLQRQLDSHKYDPLDWAINAATLSQYYVTVNEFPPARHCLASAELIFQEAETRDSKSESEDKIEKLKQGKADIERCWVKYGLALLEASREELLRRVDQDDEDSLNKEKEEEKEKSRFTFNLELTFHEDQVTDQYLRDFSEARNVFLKVQQWLNSAKQYYVFDGFCTDYIEIVQDHSKAFKHLAFFELDFDRQCKMHKRRADMIAEICNELNPQYYLLIQRQLMFELAEVYSEMLDLKVALLTNEEAQPTIHAVKKMNSLCQQSINRYQAFLDSYKDGKPSLPDEFPELDVRPALVAMFCMGRLFSKFILSDIAHKLENMKKTEACYKFVVDYCEKHPKAAEVVPSELGICKEMVTLLPLKMEKVKRDADMRQ